MGNLTAEKLTKLKQDLKTLIALQREGKAIGVEMRCDFENTRCQIDVYLDKALLNDFFELAIEGINNSISLHTAIGKKELEELQKHFK